MARRHAQKEVAVGAGAAPTLIEHRVLPPGTVNKLHVRFFDEQQRKGYFDQPLSQLPIQGMCWPSGWGPPIDKRAARCGSAEYDWRGADAPRLFIVRDFRDWVAAHNLSRPEHLLVTSIGDPELYFLRPVRTTSFIFGPDGRNKISSGRTGRKVFHFCEHEPTRFACGNLHDIPSELNPSRDFDLVVIGQTFEHLYDPLLCLHHLRGLLRPGGNVFTSAPAQNRPHMTPHHFFHYTPAALTVLFLRAGFEIVERGQWGSLEYLKHLPYKWPDYKELGPAGLRNDPHQPVQTWVLARKPG